MDVTTLPKAKHALVCPQDFSQRMNSHWTKSRSEGGLGQHSSSDLQTLWRIMGENFGTSIVEAASGVQSPWRILQPPTGTGKTQGTCVYAAMQADLNRETADTLKPVGMLIVTRLREDANSIQNTINGLAGRSVAVVHHSDNYAKPEELHESDVVIITHQAFLNAKRNLKGQDWRPWDRLVSWKGGQRLLTIIDEALANVVDESSATTENLAFVIGLIPPAVRAELPEQVAVLEEVHKVLLAYVDLEDLDGAMSLIWGEGSAPACVDFAPLISAMLALPYDRIVYNHTSTADRTRLAKRVEETINAVQSCLDQFAYYSKSGEWHSINSAALAVPLNAPGPVVLDATARANFLWDLFEEGHVRPTIPGRARDYSSVRLHVARGSGLGKNAMIERIRERLSRVRQSIEAAVRPERSVFMCVHKDVEEVITKRWAEKAKFKQFSMGHWGAVDGRNTWQDFDTALILGLPYRPQTWATNMFCALQGAQDNQWLKSPEWKQYKNVRKEMEQRQLSVSVIQAMNRICCRHVIDAEGRCPAADIFIVLPHDGTGDAILDDIKADMPGIIVSPWDFSLDPAKEKRPRAGSSHVRLIEYMRKATAGIVSLSVIQHALQLSSVKKLRETLNNTAHPTTQALMELGVKYIPGVGRGSKSFLVKAA
ncbi:DEAD/DEAH box helicase family protein [Bradyrhizobium japonicum]|uniref:DEAD/DEAH box helicase family protein n=1 Tax=Bradyrhizobium japonicum TaxID=375 RepID=UPI001B8A7805|nr:DEAD/DEAH box helicase family protein [Bradyrhizobium japonicum]MBR0969605.1 DEAD/DEAH box helicase family protein [Bradyrhizobium japonicum]